jgi:hypothetical protein
MITLHLTEEQVWEYRNMVEDRIDAIRNELIEKKPNAVIVGIVEKNIEIQYQLIDMLEGAIRRSKGEHRGE